MTELVSTSSPNINLSSFIGVSQNGVRSVNIERDLGDDDIAARYILTTQSRMTLDRLLSKAGDKTPVRAWTLTGPYGSGKSFFSLFLMNLLGQSQSGHEDARRRLGNVDSLLLQKADALVSEEKRKGLLPVAITGFRGSIVDNLRHGLKRSLQGFSQSAALQSAVHSVDSWSSTTSSREIVNWFETFVDLLTSDKYGYQGLLLVFDEMGKPLEFAASHPDQADVYLLQELAEYASRSGTKSFILISILHQSFERYAALLDIATQQEWAKVQGRFEDVAFQEPPALQMRLIASAIVVEEAGLHSELDELIRQNAHDAVRANWCPALMGENEFFSVCRSAYPLHPAVLVALPYVFRRLAQNERSIFAFLSSTEPFGFQEFLHQNAAPAFIRLADLYDYLIANFQGRLYASGRARVLLETQQRLQGATDLDALHIDIVKTIGLLNWLSEISHLHATKQTLFMALRSEKLSDKRLARALKQLQDNSVIVHRRFNDSYSVWQGSDVDIEAQIREAQRKLSRSFSVADALQQHLPPRPQVARRHSYETGTTRFFEVAYVDALNKDRVVSQDDHSEGASGRILLLIPTNTPEVSEFIAWAEDKEEQQGVAQIVGIVTRPMRLTDLLHELRCLNWVKDNTPELRDDPVARRELRIRLATIEAMVNNEVDRSFNLHQLAEESGCVWYFRGEKLRTSRKSGVSHHLSAICDELYHATPILRNELINRTSLSSQAAAARRSLIEAMLKHPTETLLGIKRYPPERSMYESLLWASKLHVEVSTGYWEFREPDADDPLRLRPMWQAISEFVFVEPPRPREVNELIALLGERPFGLQEGIVPILLCAFTIVKQQELTLYREGTLLPEPTIADWEVLLRRPELFQIAGCRVDGPLVDVVERFASGLGTEPAVMPIVRDLVRRFKTLPERTWRTQKLSPRALALRDTINNARSPEQLLFKDMPEALSMGPLTTENVDQERIETFFQRLNETMMELAQDLPKLQAWARDHFLRASDLPLGEEGWLRFLSLAQELAPRVANPNVGPLLRRADGGADPHSALESVLALIAGRPIRTWSDFDTQHFVNQAEFLGRLIQAEQNGTAPTIQLNKDERLRSEEMIAELERFLENQYEAHEWPQLQVALQLLAQQYQSKLIDEPL